MVLKEKLERLKIKFLESSLPINRDFEFDACLEEHELGEQNVYRLRYVNYHRIGEGYGMGPDNVGIIDWPFKPFMLPVGMSREDAFKVLSYLSDYIEEKFDLEPCSHRSVILLNEALDLKRLGFIRLNIKVPVDDTDIIDLFTVSGRLLLFKKSDSYSKYFEWYTEGVTFDEVKDIYAKYGIDFYDLIILDNDKQNEYSRKLEMKK